jgi:Spy/CpxP family protein refolding chaperone
MLSPGTVATCKRPATRQAYTLQMSLDGRGVSVVRTRGVPTVRRLIVLLVATLMVPLGPVHAQERQQRRKWWQDEQFKTELGLTVQQSASVEATFQSALPKLKAAKQQLDGLESELSRLIAERTADESVVAAQIDRVEAARAELSKNRTLMLYRIHRILTPEQNAKLQIMHDRWEKERGRETRRPQS